MGIEQRPNIRKGEPTTYNKRLSESAQFTMTDYSIDNLDGTTTIVEYYHEGYFAVRNLFKGNPNDFFIAGENLSKKVTNNETLHEGKTSRQLLISTEEGRVRTEGDSFERLEELEEQAKVKFARFETPTFAFIIEWDDNQQYAGTITELLPSAELADFFEQFAANNLDKEALIEILDDIKSQMSI